MITLLPSNKIYISESIIRGAGRGVFASKEIKNNEIIEICPVIEIKETEIQLLRRTELKNYYFLWRDNLNQVVIALGFGSIYNHSYNPNATYIKNFKDKVIEFKAIKKIKKDSEITVNYNFGNPSDKSTLWIKSIKPYK